MMPFEKSFLIILKWFLILENHDLKKGDYYFFKKKKKYSKENI